MQVTDLPLIAVNLIVLDITKVAGDVKLFGKGLTDIPTDVVHSGGLHMVQPCFKPIGESAKLACAGTISKCSR